METVLESKPPVIKQTKEPVHDTNSQVAVLRLTNYSEEDSGFYWCTVQSDNETLPNPSKVINITICSLTSNKVEDTEECGLFKSPEKTRCADHSSMTIGDIDKVQLGPTEACIIKNLETSTTADTTFPNPDQSEPTSSVSHVWMIVGIVFAIILIAIIILMLIAIVYLNHKKNKIRGTVA